MNLRELHEYSGKLLTAGVSGELPIVALVQSELCEISDAAMLAGEYKGDPSPKMIAFSRMEGQMLALIPISEDQAALTNPSEAGPATHIVCDLPVEPPYR